MDATVVDCVMISANYWPTLDFEQTFTHHPVVLSAIDQYKEAYNILKKPRQLHLADQIGLVDLELDFKDGSMRKFVVDPLQVGIDVHTNNNVAEFVYDISYDNSFIVIIPFI